MLCEICGEEEASNTCRLCGRRVCGKHYNFNQNICRICEEALCSVCGRNLSIGYCKICGRIICEDCSVELSIVEYVCIDCYRKTIGSL